MRRPARAAGQPSPPPDLASRRPLVKTLSAGQSVHRFYSKAHEPAHFDRASGSGTSRFNSPDGSYGVMYTSEALEGAFAETFLRNPDETLVSLKLVQAKGYARFEVTRALSLVRLYGPGLARVGATAEVSHRSPPYDVTQQWSKALRDAFPAMAGIAYTSRHDDQAVCFALYEEAAQALREVEREPNLIQPWFATLVEQYRLGIEP